MDFEVETSPTADGNGLLVAVCGELDMASCERLKPAGDEAVFGRRPLILDLSACSFIDSSGLRLMLQIHRGLTEDDAPSVPMAIVIGNSATRKMFSLTAIDHTIPLFDTLEEALEWLKDEQRHNGSRPPGAT
jgi:anti-sigma B factor antagonist